LSGVAGICGQFARECLVLTAQSIQAHVESPESFVEARRVEVARLEGLLVALDRSLGAADLLGERSTPFFKGAVVAVPTGGGLFDGLAYEAAVAVDLGELREGSNCQMLWMSR
jgi:hypothetical protein